MKTQSENTPEDRGLANLLKLNNWPIKEFIIFVWVLLLLLVGSIALDSVGLKIPILRELTSFLFLTFIIGFLLLRILRVHKLSTIETVLYSVGLSLSFLMLSGLLINLAFHAIGVGKPLSASFSITTLILLTIILCIVCYQRERDLFIPNNWHISSISPSILLLLLVPFLSVFGAYMMNVYDSNILILSLLPIISLIPVLIAFNKIPEELHGLAVFIASISILLHVSLISWHLWGWDIHLHFYWSNLVRQNLYWNPSEYPLLLTTILPTIYSIITGLSLVWVYKLFFPFFFSLVPLGIYSVCRKEFNSKLTSALAPFPFMFYYAFFETFPVKQLPSELFVILLVMLVVDKRMANFNKMFLAIIFSFALIVSHYGVSYFFMLILIFAVILLYLSRTKIESKITRPSFALLFFILASGWFMYVAGGHKFELIVALGHNIATNLVEMLHSPPSRSGVSYATRAMPNLIWVIYKYLNYLLVAFISLGIIRLLVSLIKKNKSCSNSFAALSIGSYGFLVSSIIITFCMGFDRTMQITLVLLAPFAVVGCKFVFDTLLNIFQRKPTTINTTSSIPIGVFGIFLMVFFLFSSGFIFEIAGEDTPPYCVALDKDNWLPWKAYYKTEVSAADWLNKFSTSDKIATQTSRSGNKDAGLLHEYYGHGNLIYFDNNTKQLSYEKIYFYLGNLIANENKIPYRGEKEFKYKDFKKSIVYRKVLIKSNKIYCSERSLVYYG